MATYYVDSNTSSLWVASTAYVLGARIVCTTAAAVASRGYVKECTTAGTSAATEPVWTNVPGDTITDGTAVWTTREATDITNASAFLYYLHNHRIAAGDRIWLRTTHSETTAAGIDFAAIGTAAAQVELLVAGTWANNPTTLGTGALVATTGVSDLAFAGSSVSDGINFSAGAGSSNTDFIFNSVADNVIQIFRNCTISLLGTGTGAQIRGVSSNNLTSGMVILDNVWLRSSSLITTGGFEIGLSTKFVMNGGGIATAWPSIFLNCSGNRLSGFTAQGADFSFLGAGSSLVNVNNQRNVDYAFRNCKFGAGSLTTGSIVTPGTVVVADNVSSGAINYQHYTQSYEGTLIHESTIVKTGGQSDGTTTLSEKAVSSAGTKFYAPLYSSWMPVWIDTTAVAKAITIDILHDSLTALTDAEAWIEVKYLSSATVPIESSVSDAAASMVAAGVAQDASTATWTTTGLTNPNKQKLVSPAFTTQMKGYAMARVAIAKPSYTVYVDGNPQVA